MNLDAEDFLYELAFEATPEEPNEDQPEPETPDTPYDPWENEDSIERRRDPLRKY